MGRAYDDLVANLKFVTARLAPVRTSEQIPVNTYSTGLWAQIVYAPDAYRARLRQTQGRSEL